MKFMSTSFPSCSYKWHEEETWICLMCFALKYSELQCSDWASWVSGRIYTITIGKLSKCPEVEFLFFCLMMWPAGQGTADRAVTLLYISLFRAGFVNEVLHATTFLSRFNYFEVKTHICHFHVEQELLKTPSLCHTSRGTGFHSREIWKAKSSPASWGPF